MLQDSITYGQWLTNVSAIGMGNAASSFAMKIGSGIGTAALGWILSAGGFDKDPASASSIVAINVSCIWVPVITCAIGLVCLALFDLDNKYDLILADLQQGKWKGTSDLEFAKKK
jgi:GPH family glycoside/pentoside/hexuronide:cation symporter